MGALTFKPSAYQARPWELTRVTIPDYYTEAGGSLVLHLRGGRVLRVNSSGWLRDRVRFVYDGFRRQRLVHPLRRGQFLSWGSLPGELLRVISGGGWAFRVDPGGEVPFWLVRGATLLGNPGGPACSVVVDVNRGGTLYFGAYGLPPAVTAGVAIPVGTPPEEEGYLPGPVGGLTSLSVLGVLLQLVTPVGGYYWEASRLVPGGVYPQGSQRAIFQVSPLQRLLPPAW